MNWFKNLNATPRLLLSFGVLIVLIGIISYLAIANLSQGNDRLQVLYQEDMMGAIQSANIGVARMSLGRQARDAMLNIANPAVVASDKSIMLADFVTIHSNLDALEKSFYSKEGQAVVKVIRDALPAYERSYHDLYERVGANDLAGAKTALAMVTTVGQPLYDASDRARALKETRGEEKFQANNQSYQSARALMISAAAIAVVLGVLLSIFIARGFSLPLGQAVVALEQVAAGNLTITVDVLTKDEVGRMTGALNTAVEKLRSTLQGVAASAANSNSSSRELAAAAGKSPAVHKSKRPAWKKHRPAWKKSLPPSGKRLTTPGRPANWQPVHGSPRNKGRKWSPAQLPPWLRSILLPPRSPTSSPPSTRLHSRPTFWR